jgi:hypothetical protein
VMFGFNWSKVRSIVNGVKILRAPLWDANFLTRQLTTNFASCFKDVINKRDFIASNDVLERT